MVVASLGFAATVFGPLAANGQSIATKTFEIAMRSADEETRRGLLQMILLACDLAPEGEAEDAAGSCDGSGGEETAEAQTDRTDAGQGRPAAGSTSTVAFPDDSEGMEHVSVTGSGEDSGIFAREISTETVEAPSPAELTEVMLTASSGSGSLLLAAPLITTTTQTETVQIALPSLVSYAETSASSLLLLDTGNATTDPNIMNAREVIEEATSGDSTSTSAPLIVEHPASTPDEEGAPDDVSEEDPEETPDTDTDDGLSDDDLASGGNTGNDVPDQSGQAVSPFGATVVSGRVTTLDLGDPDVAQIEIVRGPAYGNLTVNPDNTMALVLTGETRSDDISFKIRVTYENGNSKTLTPTLDVTEGPQLGGWGLGDFYMLETDADDRIVVEHSDNHRKVYVSESTDALSLADIAAIENLELGSINQKFFLDHPDYGATEDMAVSAEAASMIWRAYSSRGVDEPTSNWMLFERGYEYDDITGLMASGESALNPVYYGAYGQGDDPVLNQAPTLIKGGGQNIVFQDIELAQGARLLSGSNIVFDHVSVGKELNIQNIDGFTLRYADVVDVVTEEASSDLWSPHRDRASGIYAAKSEGVLIEDSFFDHNGWEDGYDYFMSAKFGQPPSQYSHNVYLQSSNLDVTFRDNIVMRAAGDGAQIRSGGYIEDNVFIDNNNAVLAASGTDQLLGNYSLLLDNVVTSAGHKDTETGTGGLSRGISNNGYMASMVGNIVAHLADPSNLAEWLAKGSSHYAIRNRKDDPFYDDTIIHNWVGSYKNEREDYDARNANTEDLSYDVLDRTTIQIFTAKLLRKPTATIEDLADYLRGQADDGALNDVVDADLIISFFRKGFGLDVALRDEAETLRFVPNDLGEGVRWDNRLNWTSETLPGHSPDDNVELGGNWVIYGDTAAIGNLSLGSGGRLTLTHGRLDVMGRLEAGAGGSTVALDNAGQLWVDTYEDSDTLQLEAAGGRFVNAGIFRGIADIVVSDDAQMVLATGGGQFALASGSSLTIRGGAAKLGIDSVNGEAAIVTLGQNSDLRFEAQEGELGMIQEFYSGAFGGDSHTIRSGIDLGGADLTVNVSGLSNAKGEYTLLYLDEMIGSFDDIKIEGLGSSRDATLILDYQLDAVFLSLGKGGKGSGKTKLETVGDQNDAQTLSPDIWDALIDGQAVWSDPLVSQADTTL